MTGGRSIAERPAVVLAVIGVLGVIYACVAYYALDRFPFSGDEYSLSLQGDLFAHGMLHVPAPARTVLKNGLTVLALEDHTVPSVAYYTVFSLAPLLVVVIAVAGIVFGPKAVQGQIVGQIEGLIGHDGAVMIQTMIAAKLESPRPMVSAR